MEVLQFVPQFGKALWDLKTMYDQHIENGKEIKELQGFIQDYDQHIPALGKRFKEGGGNILGVAVLKHLETEIMEATNKLKKWSRNKSFFRVFNSAQRMQKIEKLHIKVMASVQKSLGIANLSMLLDVQATQAIVLESNAELKSLLITSIRSMHGTLPPEVRDEVVEASTLSFADPKFWEDILAAVDNHRETFFSQEAKNLYEDPITTKLMIDPVVASDGNTYCRWTIIDNNLTKDPYNPNEDLRIVIDNLTFRRGLFEKFPGQYKKFQQRRNNYRSNALSLASKELLGDAILALQYVLQWDKNDKECVAALKQVQGALKEAKEHYIQSPLVLSDELDSGRPTCSQSGLSSPQDKAVMVGLVKSLSSPIPGVQRLAAYDIRLWSKQNMNYKIYFAEQGAIPPLVELLFSPDQKTQEHAVTALLNLSIHDNNKERIVVAGAIEPIVEVLKNGRVEARENAAATLFSLSLVDENKVTIGSSGAIPALVTLLQNGTPRGKKDAATALFNLSIYQGNKPRAVQAGVVPTLMRLIADQPATMLDEALAILAILATHPEGRPAIRTGGPVSLWLKIIVSGSPRNKENTAAVLLALCSDAPGYIKQAKESNAIELLIGLAHSPESTSRAKRKAIALLELLRNPEPSGEYGEILENMAGQSRVISW